MKIRIKKKLFQSAFLTAATVLLLSMCAGCGQTSETGKNADNIEKENTEDTGKTQNTGTDAEKTDSPKEDAVSWTDLVPGDTLPLEYADQFSVTYYGEEEYALITIGEDEKFLVVPENEPVPENLPDDITPLLRPLNNMYLAATSAMDFFCHLDAVDQITLSGTDSSGWYLEEPKKALEEEKMEYAGKYSAPDYERIVEKSCSLAIESTMIYHCPQVKEQLENLGVPVLVERSSYEADPLGRMEWIKLYGVLTEKEELAKSLFSQEMENLKNVKNQQETGKTVAFFYITSKGSANVRKPGDYVAKMIAIAGGTYIPQNTGKEEENALSTMNMEMEAFYAQAKDADYIIYNSTIDGELESLSELLAKSPLLADFKAVKEGHVWCTGKNLFQETMGLGSMIQDIHRMLTEEEPDPGQMHYIHPLR